MPATHHSSGRPRGRSIGLWSLIAIAITALAMFLVTLPRDAGAVTGGQTFTSVGSHNFVVPPGVTSIDVQAWGGGGGGATGALVGSGGGGGGGGYTEQSLAVTPGETLTVVVGSGGSGGTATFLTSIIADNGDLGGDSRVTGVSGTVTASGGGGGSFSIAGLFGAGGTGGAGTFVGTSGENGLLIVGGNAAGGAGGGAHLGGSGGIGASCATTGVLNLVQLEILLQQLGVEDVEDLVQTLGFNTLEALLNALNLGSVADFLANLNTVLGGVLSGLLPDTPDANDLLDLNVIQFLDALSDEQLDGLVNLCLTTGVPAGAGGIPGGGGGGGHATSVLELSGTDGADGARGEVRITWDAPNVGTVQTDADPDLLAVNGVSIVTVTVFDDGGPANRIAGARVTLEALGGPIAGLTILPDDEGYTDANGEATFTVRYNDEGTLNFRATALVGAGDDVSSDYDDLSITWYDAADVDADRSSISVSPTTVLANGVSAATVTVSVRDAGGDPIPGIAVTLQQNGTSSQVSAPSPISGNTNAGGEVTFQVTNDSGDVGATTYTALAGGVLVQGDPLPATVTWLPVTTDAGQSSITASPTTVNANGVATSLITVTVRDSEGVPREGVAVALVNDGGGIAYPVSVAGPFGADGSTPAAGTDVNGVITFRVSSNEDPGPGGTAVDFTAQAGASIGPVEVLFVQPGADAGESTVTVHPSNAPHISATVIANGVSYATVTVTVRDSEGQPVVGEEVILHMDPGAQATINDGLPGDDDGEFTDANGMVTFEVRSTFPAWNGAATLVNFTATAGSDLGTVGVMFTPQVPDLSPATLMEPLKSTITASPPAVLANGTDRSEITVTLRDADGVQLIGPGPTVTLLPEVQGGGVPDGLPVNTIVLPGPMPAPVQAENGIARFWVASNTVQTVEYSAQISGPTIDNGMPVVNGILDSEPAVVTFTNVIADPGTSTVEVAPDPLVDPVIANGVSYYTVTITLRDADGLPVVGVAAGLEYAGLLPVPTTFGIGTDSLVSDADGKVVLYVASIEPGSLLFDAVSNGVLEQIELIFIEQTPDASESTVEATPAAVLANGVTQGTVRVTVRDADGEPIPGASVHLMHDGTVPGHLPVSWGAELTDVNGQVVYTVTNTVAETVTYSATADLLAIGSDTIVFKTPVPEEATSEVVANPISVIANGVSFSTVTVTLRDGEGVPIAGEPVILTGNVENDVTVIESVTNPLGVATFEVRSTTVGTETFTAASGAWSETVDVDFTPQISDPTKATVVATDTVVLANGVSDTTVVVTLFDEDGVQLLGDGVFVTLMETFVGGLVPSTSIVAPNFDYTIGGAATFTVRSTTVQNVEYSANADGDDVDATDIVYFAPPSTDPEKSYLTADPLSVIANGVSYSTVTVHLRDADEQPLVGGVARLTGDGTATIEPLNGGVSNNNGEARFRVRRTSPATVTFSAFTGPDPLPPISNTVDVEFTEQIVHPGPLNNGVTTSTVVANPTSVPANGESFSVVTVTVRDDDGVGIPGKTVTLAGDGQPETLIGPASGPTDANGQVIFEVRRTSVGAVLFTATVDGVTLGQQAGVTFTEPVVSSALSYLSANPQAVRADGVESAVITVTVVDTDGVPLEGVTDITLSQDGSSTISAVSGPTNAAGEATFTVTNTVIEQVTYSATVDGTPVANTTWVVFWNPDGAPPVVGGEGCTFPPVPAGQFLPALPPFGVAISIWGGGPISSLPQAISYWGTYNNQLINYIPGAPAFVNARFNAAYANGIPACLGFIVRR